MNVSQALQQILDLPLPFRRPSSPFSWIMNAIAGGLTEYTASSDGIQNEESGITSSSASWLDVWGQIFDIQRLSQESDSAYRFRVLYTLASGVSPPLAIQSWSRLFLSTNTVYVTESFPTAGYSISIPSGLSQSLLSSWVLGLARIRPAGVPFTVTEQVGPLILGSYAYVGSTSLAGAYLGAGSTPLNIALGTSTLNASPLVATPLLTDPLLNGTV